MNLLRITFITATIINHSFGFLWNNYDNAMTFPGAFPNLGHLFPGDAFQSPNFVYQTSNTQFTNDKVDYAPPTLVPNLASEEPPALDLRQAEPRPMGLRNARQYAPELAGKTLSNNVEFILPIPSGQPTVYGPIPSSISVCPPGFLCCDNGSIYRNSFKLLKCCGENSFDDRYERCQVGFVSPVRPDVPVLTPAERLSRISCGGKVYFGPNNLRCCNGSFFDSAKFVCHEGNANAGAQSQLSSPTSSDNEVALETETGHHSAKVEEPSFELPEMGPGPLGPQYVVCEIYRYLLSPRDLQTWGCCGAQIYNYKRENCTSGEIVPQRTMERQRLIPIGEIMVYCNGGVQHWVSPSALAQVRCCGSQLCPINSVRPLLSDGQLSHNHKQMTMGDNILINSDRSSATRGGSNRNGAQRRRRL